MDVTSAIHHHHVADLFLHARIERSRMTPEQQQYLIPLLITPKEGYLS
jgi:hypothetical protein